MALTYAVRDVKRLAAVNDGSDTSEGMAIVRADVTLGSASDVGTAASTASLVLSGSAILSSLGLGSAGKVLELLAGTVRTSANVARVNLLAAFDPANEVVTFVHKQTNNSAADIVQAGSVDFSAADICRVTLLGQIGK